MPQIIRSGSMKRTISNPVLWQNPHTIRKWKSRDNRKTPPFTLVTQQLRTDLGRSVGVTIFIQLVLLNLLTGSKPSHSPQQLCNQGNKYAYIISQWAESRILIISKENNNNNNLKDYFKLYNCITRQELDMCFWNTQQSPNMTKISNSPPHPLGTWNVSEMWGTFRWTYSPSLVTVSSSKL